MAKKSILQTDVRGTRVLVRADFNVPTDDANRITDDRRIVAALPTIRHILKGGGSVVAVSHFGRPAGTGHEPDQSLRPVHARLAELLKGEADVLFAGQVPTDEASRAAVAALKPGQVLLLENLRFEKGEKKGDPAFASVLAGYGDVYVNDAFGASHRNDASMVALPNAMKPRPCVAGLLLMKEIEFLGHAIEHPMRPFVAIVGGAKVSDKLNALSNLLASVDTLVVGGAMAYTFLRAQGVATGRSLVEEAMVAKAGEILSHAGRSGKRLLLPSDHVCGRELRAGTETCTVTGAIPDGWMGLDIGPATRRAFADAIVAAGQVVWNGPMGAFETPPFEAGTRAVADAVVAATARGAVTIAGGGDTAAALEGSGLAGGLTHVSTGGGASLEMLEGRKFDSVAALDDA
jgi:phosphoglycerate kinase